MNVGTRLASAGGENHRKVYNKKCYFVCSLNWLLFEKLLVNILQVDVVNNSGTVDLSNYVDNGEWQLLAAKSVRNVIYYSCCPDEPFPDVTFWFHLRRRTTYYTFNVIIPCLMLSILTLASFVLPSESGEKVSLGLTVLLAFSVFHVAHSRKYACNVGVCAAHR